VPHTDIQSFDSEQMCSYDWPMFAGNLFLVHWNKAEAEQYAKSLRAQNWKVEMEFEDGARAAKLIKGNQPDAVVIFHTRLPSHGRATAAYLAETKATRHIPLLIVGGEGEALQKTKTKLPGAIYSSEKDLFSALLTTMESK